jgi:hypothetical protein
VRFSITTLAATVVVALSFAIPLSAQEASQRSARDYFNELKAANNFSHYKDTFVCFSDDDNPGFAVISRGTDVLDEMRKAGVKPDKLMIQSRDLLFVETYYKGISNDTAIYDPVGKSGTQWFGEFTSPMHGKIVYSFNWVTGRYRMSVYVLDRSQTVPAKEVFGKCELIHPPL